MFKIAFRNVLRNGRRSLMTASAVAVGATALILFGEYNALALIGMETMLVENSGHLSVFKKGYFEFGSARPMAYGISDYDRVITLIRNDPEMKAMVNVVTPSISLGGIAGNAALDKSKTFFGSGYVPSERQKMYLWDEHQLYRDYTVPRVLLDDKIVDHGVVGRGLARILGLCKPLNIQNCAAVPAPTGKFISEEPIPAGEKSPRLDLLSSAGGAPNIVAFYVKDSANMGAKELDDSYVGMPLPLAQRLLYGGGDKKVTSIVIQLNHTGDIAHARARLDALFAENKLALEVRDFKELAPNYMQIINYLQSFFSFLALILGMIVAFTLANTMGMSVMERTNEIGTARAMGVRRGAIRRQFLLEGAILGAIGATAGIVLGAVLTYWLNNAQIMYTPPGNATPVPFHLLSHGIEKLQFGVWISLVLLSSLASLVPANRAARMKVVDALRHV
jgi:putative ABC transport system permease protein